MNVWLRRRHPAAASLFTADRYLEHYNFACAKNTGERESLLRNSPHIMWPMRFFVCHNVHFARGMFAQGFCV